MRPETWDLRPETWDLRPETWDLRSGTSSWTPENILTFGNIRPVKMNHFSKRNPVFEVPRARRRQNDKFVTVGLPEAKTIANLIILGLWNRSPISWTQNSKKIWRVGGGREALTINIGPPLEDPWTPLRAPVRIPKGAHLWRHIIDAYYRRIL